MMKNNQEKTRLADDNHMQKLTIKVKPNSKQVKIVEDHEGNLVIYLKSPPVDGKANAELIEILAEKFSIPQKSVRIKSGFHSRQKVVEIDIA